MGTVVNIELRPDPGASDASARAAEAAVAEAMAWLHWVDETFSTYRPASEISRLGRGEIALGECHPHLRRILALCDELAAATGGYFDALASGHLDPSGVVKGWAIEEASAILSRRGWPDHLVEGGGDIRARSPDGGRPWLVGIAHPFRRDALGAVVSVVDGAVATSGIYERGLHVVDPHTGRPATGLASVTVLGAELVRTDAYATAALARGADAARWLAGMDGYEALVVDVLGRSSETAGFAGRRLDRRIKARPAPASPNPARHG